MKKLLVLVAGAAGYVLGTRAGRERYEQIKRQSSKVWNSPTVQAGVDEAEATARQAADAAGEKMSDVADTVGSKVKEKIGHDQSTAAGTASAKATPPPSSSPSPTPGSGAVGR